MEGDARRGVFRVAAMADEAWREGRGQQWCGWRRATVKVEKVRAAAAASERTAVEWAEEARCDDV